MLLFIPQTLLARSLPHCATFTALGTAESCISVPRLGHRAISSSRLTIRLFRTWERHLSPRATIRPISKMDTLDINPGHSRHSSISAIAAPLPKKLIVCCDGTWMDSDNGWVKGKGGSAGRPQNPSNVTRIARAIQDQDQDHHQQIVYYQAGIGTGIGLYDHLIGGGTGAGLSENIREAYMFLASNYSEHTKLQQKDSIFLLGFSRGAFTARSLGGFIGAIGILKKRAIPHFYEIFQDWENAGNPKKPPQFFETFYRLHPNFKPIYPAAELARDKLRINEYIEEYRRILHVHNLTQEVEIKCIGVWDTVGALGVPVNPLFQRIFHLPSFFKEYKWFDTTIDNHVKNAFQALGLDERRFPYSPAIWERPKGVSTNLKQVWFPGAHSNVGGSYNDQTCADITLCWMMDQLSGNTMPATEDFEPLNWIKFDDDYITDYYEMQVKQYQAADHPTFRGWGKGKVYDSLTFPQSLAGQKVRKPGQYHKTDYDTGFATSELLHDTCEYIHSSVRYRIDAGAGPVESDWDQAFPHGLNFQPWFQWLYRYITPSTRTSTYQPQRSAGPLHYWKLDDGHLSHRQPNGVPEGPDEPAAWVYEGPEVVENRVLREEVLGPFERMLKDKDRNVRHVLEVSEEGIVGRIRKSLHAKTI